MAGHSSWGAVAVAVAAILVITFRRVTRARSAAAIAVGSRWGQRRTAHPAHSSAAYANRFATSGVLVDADYGPAAPCPMAQTFVMSAASPAASRSRAVIVIVTTALAFAITDLRT